MKINYHLSIAEATPKTVMKLMGIPGLTLYHLKSHLQVKVLVKFFTIHSPLMIFFTLLCMVQLLKIVSFLSPEV